MDISNDIKSALIAAAIRQEESRKKEVVLGRPTKLHCTCGGLLHERPMEPPPKELLGQPPRSRNRRIRKKQLKKWRVKAAPILMLNAFLRSGPRSGYVCGTCKRYMGFYQAIGRNMFLIEPLPPGALPTYDRDPDVTSVVMKE